ncbi:MAG: DUF4012 domain-containing protein [Mycobacteriales bacterium]
MRIRSRMVAIGGLVAVGAVVQLGVDALRADWALHDAEGRLPALQAAVLAGDDVRVAVVMRRVQDDAETADRATNGPLWDLGAHLPWVGRSVAETSTLTHAVRQVAVGVVPRLIVGARDVRPLVGGSGTQVDLAALRRSSPAFATALDRLQPVDDALGRLPEDGVLPPVDAARQRLVTKVHLLTSGLRQLVAASEVGPAMLGADGPRHYFVGFQNNAESRGTGGLLGAYAIVTADHGHLTVDRLGSDLDLYGLPPPRRDLGADYRRLYGHDAWLWQNTNMSGHFPYAAQLWLDMWQQRTGEHLDGAFATDPVALSYLLDATGPVPLPGGSAVTAGDVVAQTEQTAYLRYAGDDLARKDFLVGVASAVLGRLLGPHAPDRSSLVRAVARAAAERRFMVYSAHPAEQASLAGTAVAGEVPQSPGPFAFLVVNNTAGNKIDYYLDRSLRYDLGPCRGGSRESTLTAVLRNDVPAVPLPRFVVGRLDRPGHPVARGSSSLLVSLYVSEGAALRSATLDGRQVAVFAGRERGHPVFVLQVELPRGRPRALALHLVEPAVRQDPLVLVQSLVRDQSTVVRGPACG